MTIERKQYLMTNNNRVSDPALSNVTVLRVTREGTGFNETTSAVSNREYTHDAGGGQIVFADRGIGDESVVVVIKY
jgi:hypothetical protein